MNIQDVIWHSSWYENRLLIFLLAFVLLTWMLYTVSRIYEPPYQRSTRLNTCMLLILFIGFLILSFMQLFVLPKEANQWYAQTVVPYIKQLPQKKTADIQIKPTHRYEDNLFLANVGYPDEFGFPVDQEYYGTLHRDEQTKTAYFTYKDIPQNLGRGIDKGYYDIHFYLPADTYDALTKEERLSKVMGEYETEPEAHFFSNILLWLIILCLIPLSIALVISHFLNVNDNENDEMDAETQMRIYRNLRLAAIEDYSHLRFQEENEDPSPEEHSKPIHKRRIR